MGCVHLGLSLLCPGKKKTCQLIETCTLQCLNISKENESEPLELHCFVGSHMQQFIAASFKSASW